jgi:hypothetical protein
LIAYRSFEANPSSSSFFKAARSGAARAVLKVGEDIGRVLACGSEKNAYVIMA